MDSLMPHGYCLSWNPQLLWLFVIGNSLIALSYYSIPATLGVLVSKRRKLMFHWMFVLFAAFIFACGTTHLMKIWTIWHPDYWLEGFIDAFTGVLSAATAVLLWPLLPKVLALPSPEQLEAEILERRKAEQKFRGLLESAPDAMIIANQQGEILIVNAQTERLFGYQRDEIIGKKVETLIHKASREGYARYRNTSSNVLQIGDTGAELELYALRKNQTKLPVEIRFGSIETDEGVLISSSIRDITDRKLAEELKRRIERKEANEHFIGLLAHELKAPIIGANHVLNALANKQLGEVNDKQVEILRQLIDGQTATLAMINDILEVYQFERDIDKLAFSTVNMIDLVKQCVREASSEAEPRGVKIQAHYPESMPMIIANGKGLQRVLENLLKNAIRISSSPSLVSVSLHCVNGERVELSVQDTGPGIAPEVRDRLFKRFWMGSIEKHFVPGRGLGLYYCKQIVDVHQGTIECDTELGRGTTFTVVLPLKSAKHPDSVLYKQAG
jgi:PAS domain S-box-containing protein